jgi:hypothetical protein
MSRHLARAFLPAALAVLVAGGTASAQQPPPGYQLVTDAPHVSGGLLVARSQRGSGAIQTLNQGFRDTARFFDQRPRVLGAFADTADQRAEAAFRATIGQVPVVGVAFATMDGTTTTLGLAFDTPNTFPQGVPRLLQLAGLAARPSGNCPPPGTNWQVAPYPDGSGQMMLPGGWRMASANMGAAEAQGPHGYVGAAIWFQAVTRAGAAQKLAYQRQVSSYVGVPLPQAQLVVVDPTDPASALIGIRSHFAPLFRQLGISDSRNFRVIRAVQVPVQAIGFAQAGFVHLEFQENNVLKQGLSYVLLSPVDYDGGWLYWETGVNSPSACFEHNLPTLLHIAASARTADHVLQGRINGAVKSMQEAADMQYQGYRRQQQSDDRRFDNWSEAFRGTRIVEDTHTGTHATVDLGISTDIVRKLNEQEPGRYREIPLRELNR